MRLYWGRARPSTSLVEQNVKTIFPAKTNYAVDQTLKAAASISPERNFTTKYSRIIHVSSSDDESLELEEISRGEITIRLKESMESEEIDTEDNPICLQAYHSLTHLARKTTEHTH